MNKIEKNEPLVSIIVVAYNSSKFVIDTLESAKKQTYRNIELIVTDDGSTDNTVVLCSNWIEENKDSFVRAELITSPKNTGTAPNANRGLLGSKGEWIKFIAADDMLLSNSIAELITFVKQKENLRITFLVHGITPFKNGKEFLPVFPPEKIMSRNAKQQLIHLLRRGNCISGSAFFLERKTLMTFGGFDENYKLLEDYPLLIKYTQNNIKIWFIMESLVSYRIHGNNISFESSYSLHDSFRRFRSEILYPLYLKHKLYLTYWHRYLISKDLERNSFKNKILMSLSPINWICRFYRILGKSYFYNYKLEFQKNILSKCK